MSALLRFVETRLNLVRCNLASGIDTNSDDHAAQSALATERLLRQIQMVASIGVEDGISLISMCSSENLLMASDRDSIRDAINAKIEVESAGGVAILGKKARSCHHFLHNYFTGKDWSQIGQAGRDRVRISQVVVRRVLSLHMLNMQESMWGRLGAFCQWAAGENYLGDPLVVVRQLKYDYNLYKGTMTFSLEGPTDYPSDASHLLQTHPLIYNANYTDEDPAIAPPYYLALPELRYLEARYPCRVTKTGFEESRTAAALPSVPQVPWELPGLHIFHDKIDAKASTPKVQRRCHELGNYARSLWRNPLPALLPPPALSPAGSTHPSDFERSLAPSPSASPSLAPSPSASPSFSPSPSASVADDDGCSIAGPALADDAMVLASDKAEVKKNGMTIVEKMLASLGQGEPTPKSTPKITKKPAAQKATAEKAKDEQPTKKKPSSALKRPAAAMGASSVPEKLALKRPAAAMSADSKAFPGIAKHDPVNFGKVTVYWSSQKKWRIKPCKGSRVTLCHAFTADAKMAWVALRKRVATM
jgi:hypothetical protein